MPALCQPEGALGTKVISYYGNNADKGVPTHNGLMVLLDPTTGELQAVRGLWHTG